MSGPKIVRIVTREERQAACLSILAQVEALVGTYRAVITSAWEGDVTVTAELNRHDMRGGELRKILAADRLDDFLRSARSEVPFLQAEIARVRAEAARERARHHRIAGRRAEVAGVLITRITKDGHAAGSLLQRLQAVSEGGPDGGATAEAFALLTSGSAPASAGSGPCTTPFENVVGELETAEAWLEREGIVLEPVDPIISQLESQLAEMEEGRSAGVASFRQRLGDVLLHEKLSARALALEALSADIRKEVSLSRERVRLRDEFALACAEAALWKLAVPHCNADSSAAELRRELEDVRRQLEAHHRSLADQARREALLKALASVGYEVGAEMATAWVEDGRLVVRQPSRPGYGVEVSGSGERLQMRPIAFTGQGDEPDPARDADAETIWCGELAVLQSRLAELGDGLVVEHALAIGETPLKRVPAAVGSVSASASAVRPGTVLGKARRTAVH